MTRVVIARHGNTFAPGDVVTRVGGRTDLPLVASGRTQASVLGARLRADGFRFSAAFCSPLQRTRETAILALAAFDAAAPANVEALEFLREIDYGPDENQPEDVVRVRIGAEALARWEEAAVAPPGWRVDPETLAAGWRRLFEAHAAAGGDALAVTSNGVARFALAAYGRGSLEKLATGAFGVLALHAGRAPEVISWNVRP